MRRRNPDDGGASLVYFNRLRDRDMRVTDEEFAAHLRLAEDAQDIVKSINAFDRAYPEARYMTAEERATVFAAMRIFRSLVIPASSLTVIERRMPARYPGKR